MSKLRDDIREMAGEVRERRRIRSLLAEKIMETRKACREDWHVPPQYMLDRIEVLREIGRAVRQ